MVEKGRPWRNRGRMLDFFGREWYNSQRNGCVLGFRTFFVVFGAFFQKNRTFDRSFGMSAVATANTTTKETKTAAFSRKLLFEDSILPEGEKR